MATQIVFDCSPETARALKQLGFRQCQVWVKLVDGDHETDDQAIAAGDEQLFSVKPPPYCFVTTTFYDMLPK